MKTQSHLILFGAVISILLSSCASTTGFQTGRTVGAEAGEISFSINGTRTPDFEALEDETDTDFNIFVPNIEISGRYGISDKVDFGLRANTFLNILADVKVQIAGGQESPFAMSTGLGLGMFGFISGAGGLFNFQVPVYASYHPSENVDLYVAPRYIGQWGTTFEESSSLLNYYGANFGFLTGRKVKFGIDLALFKLSNQDSDFDDTLFQLGFGMKFKISGKQE